MADHIIIIMIITIRTSTQLGVQASSFKVALPRALLTV